MTPQHQNPLALVIEDNNAQAKIFAKAVQMAGYEFEVIKDGQIAANRLIETTPSLVILDLNLPNISGEKLLHQMRDQERFAETRIVLATADPITAERLRPEATLVLIKPISFSQLRDLAGRLHDSE